MSAKPKTVAWALFCFLVAMPLAAAAQTAEVHLRDDSLLTEASPPPAGRLPVLFVHGHNPQQSDDSDFNYKKNWWDSFNSLPSFKQALDLPQNAALGIEPYFIRFQNQGRSISDDAAEIQDALDRIIKRHDPGYAPGGSSPVRVAIISYSKGTISSRKYLRDRFDAAQNGTGPAFNPVSAFVAIAPPNHGLDTASFGLSLLNPSLAAKQLFNGFWPDTFLHNCDDSFGDPLATHYIQKLNDPTEQHRISDTISLEPGEFYPQEAPGSRAPDDPPSAGTLYVTLFADGNRDFVGGDTPSTECAQPDGRRLARNMSPHAVNITFNETEIPGAVSATVHANTVHSTAVICKALYAVVHGRSPESQICPEVAGLPVVPPASRAAAVLALDMSGSMLMPACPGCPASRLDVLKDAVELFVQLWAAVGAPEDRLGAAYFRTTVSEFSSGNEPLPLLIDASAAIVADVRAQATVGSNLTAMGGGLQQAINRLGAAAAETRRVILFTDGMQNVNPMVEELSADPPQHRIANVPGHPGSNVSPTNPPTRLDQLGGTAVDVIGVGAGEAFVGLLEAIADQSRGLKRFTVAPDDDLRRFFAEEMIDALRGFSPQLVGWCKGTFDGGEQAESFTVGGAIRRVVLKLSWKPGEDAKAVSQVRVEKDGADVTAQGRLTAGSFYRIYAFAVSPQAADRLEAGRGEWRLRFSGKKDVAYEAAAIVDETALTYGAAAGGERTLVGASMPLAVTLRLNGKPFAGPAEVRATVSAPEVGVGTLLATAAQPKGASVPAAGSEPGASIGERRLELLLGDAANWRRLQPLAHQVTLTSAGDGVFRGSFGPLTVPGAVSVVFEIEAEPPGLGRVLRTQAVAANVRFGRADFKTSEPQLETLQATADGRRVALRLRPKDAFGNFLGPDLGRRLRVDLDSGRVEPDVADLGDGRYVVRLILPQDVDPKLTLTVMGEPFFEGKLSEYDQGGSASRPIWMLVLAILALLAIALWSTRR
jgi:hypothetical protein